MREVICASAKRALLLVEVRGEADPAALRLGRVHQFADGLEDAGDRLIASSGLAFELGELVCELLARSEQIAQLRERAHDMDAHTAHRQHTGFGP